MFSLIFMAVVTRSDEWEQVPAEPGPAASGKNSPEGAPANVKAATGCMMVGAFAQEAARLRDSGVTEDSQLASIDKPGGRLYRLTESASLSAAARSAVRAGIHREIAYVYEHRELSPAQVAAHARSTCGAPQ